MLDGMKAPPKKVNPITKAGAKAKSDRTATTPAAAAAAGKAKTEAKTKAGVSTRAAPDYSKQIACSHWRTGTCKFEKDCLLAHCKNKVHTPTAGCLAGTVVKLSQPGDDCRHAVNPSDCPYRDSCIYRHGPADIKDHEKIYQERRSKKGKGNGKKGKQVLLASAPRIGAEFNDSRGRCGRWTPGAR